MHQEDFIKFIDLKTERKEYIRFILGKSKKHHSFAEWDTHIKSLLATIESSTDMYNFKRYCMDRARSKEDSTQISWGYLGLSFPLILMFSTESDRIGIKGIILMLFLMIVLFYITSIEKKNTQEKHFYEDVLNIIVQLEDDATQ